LKYTETAEEFCIRFPGAQYFIRKTVTALAW